MSTLKTIEYALVSKITKQYTKSFSTPINEYNCFYSDGARFLLFEFNEHDEFNKDDSVVFENHNLFSKVAYKTDDAHHFRVTLNTDVSLEIKAFSGKRFDSQHILKSAADSGFFNRHLLHMYSLRWSHLCREEIKIRLDSIVVFNCNDAAVIEVVSLLNYFERVFPSLLNSRECNHKVINNMECCC